MISYTAWTSSYFDIKQNGFPEHSVACVDSLTRYQEWNPEKGKAKERQKDGTRELFSKPIAQQATELKGQLQRGSKPIGETHRSAHYTPSTRIGVFFFEICPRLVCVAFLISVSFCLRCFSRALEGWSRTFALARELGREAASCYLCRVHAPYIVVGCFHVLQRQRFLQCFSLL